MANSPPSGDADFSDVETIEEARRLLEELVPEETMLEYETTGDGFGAGQVDEIRAFETRPGEIQVRPWFGGPPIWADIGDAAEDLVDHPARVVEYERV